MWLAKFFATFLYFSSYACAQTGNLFVDQLEEKSILFISSEIESQRVERLMKTNALTIIDNYDHVKLIDEKDFCIENEMTKGLIDNLTAINFVYFSPKNKTDMQSMLKYARR